MVSIIGSVLYYGSLVVPVLVFLLVYLKFERVATWKTLLISTSFSLATFVMLMGSSMALLFGSGSIAVGSISNEGFELLKETIPGLLLALGVSIILALPGYVACKSSGR